MFPVLLFLDVFGSLVFFFLGISLVFLGVFCLFSRVFRGSPGEENPWCFGGFPWCFRKDQGKEGHGFSGIAGHRALFP